MSGPITIMLVDDHALMRDTLTRRLSDEHDLSVLASLSNAGDAVLEAARLQPNIILMDIDMPGMACFDAVRKIREDSPDTRVIFLSSFLRDCYIEQAIEVRAWGYVVKSESADCVVAAIRRVASGRTYFSPEVEARLVVDGHQLKLNQSSPSRLSTLTDRELDVLRYIARGLAGKQIAELMNISKHTVHRHTTRLMDKLDIHDRVGLARYAIREGLAKA